MKMANAKILYASITNTISHLTRRGYASQSQAGAITTNLMLKKDSAKISWVPDPITGFYRPENQAHQLDAADQRAIFINNKLTPH